jgi:hypothetical protein
VKTINVRDEDELASWANHFGVSKRKIKEAVSKVGPVAKDVQAHLGK